MAGEPTISVVMAVRNGGALLSLALDSILGQQMADFEFIVIDDGSSDDTPAVLARAAATDSRLRISRQPGRGLAASLATGTMMARGRYIARMDADDVALPDRFARQIAWLDTHPKVAALGTWFNLIDERGQLLSTARPPTDHETLCRNLDRGINGLCHPSMMIRAEALAAVGGYRPQFRSAEDLDLWLRIGERFRLAILDQVCLNYRLHGASMSFRQLEPTVVGAIAARFAHERRVQGQADPVATLTTIDRGALLAIGVPPRRIDDEIGRRALISCLDAYWMGDEASAGAMQAIAAALTGLPVRELRAFLLRLGRQALRKRAFGRAGIAVLLALLAPRAGLRRPWFR